MQRSGMWGQVPLDLITNLIAVHMHREIAFLPELDCGSGIFVRKLSETSSSAYRCVRRCGTEIFNGGEELLACLPHGLVGEDQPQNGAIALHPGNALFFRQARRVWKVPRQLQSGGALTSPFHPFAPYFLNQRRGGVPQIDEIDIVRNRASLDRLRKC